MHSMNWLKNILPLVTHDIISFIKLITETIEAAVRECLGKECSVFKQFCERGTICQEKVAPNVNFRKISVRKTI